MTKKRRYVMVVNFACRRYAAYFTVRQKFAQEPLARFEAVGRINEPDGLRTGGRQGHIAIDQVFHKIENPAQPQNGCCFFAAGRVGQGQGA